MDKEMMETSSNGQSPFREVIDTTRFFPGGNRREILESLKSAVMEPVDLIILTGDEGSGKTMLCRMLEQELPEDYVLLFFSEVLESFEDVTRAIAREMEITLADGIPGGDVRELMLEVWNRLSEKNQKMLLIFDQAERIYLATLERIRKMLDIGKETGGKFHIIFSGNDTLLDNLNQLALCNFQGTEERKFIVEPLDSSSTFDYLNFCMKVESDDEVFSREVSEKIFSIAAGNIRKTNLLADDSLKSMNSESSFMVLLENVRDTLEEDAGRTKWDFSVIQQKYFAYKKWLVPAGACLVALVLILALQMARTPEPQVKKPAAEMQKLSAEFHAMQKKAEKIEQRANNPKIESKVTEQQKATLPSLKVEHIKIKKSTEVTSGRSHTTAPEKSIQKKPVIAARNEKEQVENIYNDRIAAAAKWLVGRQNNKYTIQLMVLASHDAEENLKNILAEKKYQDLADKLFILRKAASNSYIMVFYGEYPTMTDARKARRDLPQFLLKHNPYAISIRGAVEKASGG